MRTVKHSRVLLTLGLLALGLGLIAWLGSARTAGDRAPIGLFTSLPVMWAESADISDLIGGKAAQHWAKQALGQRGSIMPLDALAGPAGQGPLAGLGRLVIAQPRPLSPQENVALDAWVRGGGQLLLIADPALTEESAFALGDPRRPQGTALLSPILSRWGLALGFDDAQPYGESAREVGGVAIPVNLVGHFTLAGKGGCTLLADGLAAICTIGKGRIVALADAALLEQADPTGSRRKALDAMLDLAFAAS